MSGERTQGVVHILEDHAHKPQKVYPTGAGPVTLTSGGGAWTLGTITQIVPASTITDEFDIHWIDVSSMNSNVDYELVLYKGGSGSEVEIGRTSFSRGGVQVQSIDVPMQTEILDANERISAALMDSSGGNTANVKLFYHEY